jgi:hypothetical protein
MRSGFKATALTAALISGLVAPPSLEGAAAEGQDVAQAVDAVGLGLAVEAGTRALQGASDVIEVAADDEEDSEDAGDELHDAAVEATGKVEAIKPTTDQAGSATEAQAPRPPRRSKPLPLRSRGLRMPPRIRPRPSPT